MFLTYTILISTVVISATLWGSYQRNDTLHPLVYISLMLGFLYVVMPFLLHTSGELYSFFDMKEVSYVQFLNLICICCLLFGIVTGDRGVRRDPGWISRFTYEISPPQRRAMRKVALLLGSIGTGLFIYGIFNVGGFVAAFDSPKGGGWAQTGYLRDLKLLVIPAIGLEYMSRRDERWTHAAIGRMALYSAPLVARGVLATSRGWFFMGIMTLVGGWYLTQDRRPRFSTVLVGGGVVGLIMLFLVTYRGEIYIGSAFFDDQTPALTEVINKSVGRTAEGGIGNEYIYGVYTVLLAEEENDYYWGKRYLAYTLVRPIPSLLWSSKYESMGVSGIRWNAGTLGEVHDAPIYEQFPGGMYPGIVGDLFVEFSWGAVLVAFLIGWIYGSCWRLHLTRGGLWTIIYHTLMAMSVFGVMQTIAAAFLARVLVIAIPTFLAWKTQVQPTRSPQKLQVS